MRAQTLMYLYKAVTYRVLAMLVTGLIAFAVTWDLSLAAAISVGDFVLKVGLYWAYEHLWESSLKRVGLDPSSIDDPQEEGARYEH